MKKFSIVDWDWIIISGIGALGVFILLGNMLGGISEGPKPFLYIVIIIAIIFFLAGVLS